MFKAIERLPLLVSLLISLTNSFAAAEEPTGRITGKVTEEGTGTPIAGAKIIALVGMSVERPGFQYATAETRTDEKGEYDLNVPIGHVELCLPEPPPGYSIGCKMEGGYFNFMDNLALTRKSPSVERNFQLKKATQWNVRVATAAGTAVPNAQLMTYRQIDNSSQKGVTDAIGEGRVTTPKDGGTLTLNLFFMLDPPLSAEKQISLNIAPDFDPSNATITAKGEPGKPAELVEAAGRKASIDGATVEMKNGAPQIQLVAVQGIKIGELAGRVVDTKGQPIQDAKVVCLGVLAPPHDTCQTDADGSFVFRGLFKWPNEKPMFQLHVMKDGYAGVDTKEQPYVQNPDGPTRLPEPLVLTPGYSIRLRILGTDGQPVEGAWIAPEAIGSRLAQFARTDENGLCTIRNMPEGVSAIGLKYGNQLGREKVVIAASSATDSPLEIRLPPPVKTEVAEQKPAEIKPLALGSDAPEFVTSAWTDGKEHKLSQLRGQVVAIDFWGVWCGPCLRSIPVIKKLQEKFAGKVVFLGMHSAGTEMSQVKKLLELKQWDVPVGLDQGTEAANGETAKRYGIRGYPTLVIVDRQGKIVYDGEGDSNDREKFMTKLEGLARELGLPWPIDKDVSEDETASRLLKIAELNYTKEIEKALGK